MIGKTVLPTITSQIEALINQLVIGTKEGIIEAITKLVGSDITNTILWMANGSNHKSINNFKLFDVLQVAINGADHPSTNGMLEQLIKAINHTFDFHKKVSINMELMQSNMAQMATYGIVVGILQLTLTLLANIKTAAKSDYCLKFYAAMHAICKKYTYNHVHDTTSLQVIFDGAGGSQRVQVLKDAPTHSAGVAHSIANSVSYLHPMMDSDIDSTYTKLAYGIGTDSDLSEEERKPHRRNCKKKPAFQFMQGREKTKKKKDDKPKKNTCPRCNKFHRMKPHCVNPDKCTWNKKYKVYHFKSICNEIKVAFKPCHKFLAELGGYVEKEDSGSD